jgi:hypothetical protein
MIRQSKLYNTLEEQPEEYDYWKDKTPEERISALESLRQQFWPFRYRKPMNRSVWRLVDVHDPNKIYLKSKEQGHDRNRNLSFDKK